MTKMFFSSQNCMGATSEKTGKHYTTDSKGFINVDSTDVRSFKEGGYVVAGGMPRLSKFWLCNKCDWEASINSCPRCGSKKLVKVER